jgi:hypothetical protein
MKVKTFTGTHRFVVDRQVNEWRAKSNVAVRKTSVAFKALRYGGWDAVAGKTSKRRALAIAITVWYDEPYYQKPKPNPASTGALFLGRPMRVKTFTGTDRAAVDKQVSNWLTKTKVIVRKTDVASKALREWEPSLRDADNHGALDRLPRTDCDC